MVLAHAAFFTFLCCLSCGILFLVLNRGSPLNRAAFICALSFSLWALGQMLVFGGASPGGIRLGYNLAASGWLSCFVTIPLYFMQFPCLRARLPVRLRRTILAGQLAYALALGFIQWTDSLFVTGFVATPWGTAEVVDSQRPGFFLTFGMFAAIIVFSVAMLVLERRYNHTRKFRYHFTWMVVILVVFGSFVLVSNLVVGPLFPGPKPSLEVLAFPFIFVVVLHIMYRYRFMRLDFALLKDEVADTVSDMLVIVSPEGLIVKANRVFREHYGLAPDHKPAPLSEVLADPELAEAFRREGPAGGPVTHRLVPLVTPRAGSLMVDISLFPVRDQLGDWCGTIAVARIRNDFDQLVARFHISPQEQHLVRLLMQGLQSKEIAGHMGLSASTVKNYIYNIYQKTGVKNRVELLNLFLPKGETPPA